MPATINDVVQAARNLEDKKFALEQLRNRKSNAQSEIDAINLQLPTARAAVADAKTTLSTLIADFDPT
jgi:predicted  nucleic acid-binding Zn-ribbon protein